MNSQGKSEITVNVISGQRVRGLGLHQYHSGLLLPLQRHQVHGVPDNDQIQ